MLSCCCIAPIVVFVCDYREWNRRITADQARSTFERAIRQEQEFSQHFTAIITGDIPDDIYARVKECITLHSGSVVWVPSGEKL